MTTTALDLDSRENIRKSIKKLKIKSVYYSFIQLHSARD